MRNSVYFSFLKQTFNDLAKKSTDTTDTKSDLPEQRLSFYQEFTQKNCMRSCRISEVETVPKQKLQRSYALYKIEILTEDIKFEVKKRYSEFEAFYRQHLMGLKDMEFPSKTIFHSGCSQEVTNRRVGQLNKLIDQILKTDTHANTKIHFYDFITLFDKYEQEGLFIKEDCEQIPGTDDFLLLSLVKINDNPRNVLQIFEQMQLSLNDRKRRMTYDTTKQLLVGFQQYEGLLPFVLTNTNEIILVEGLKFLNTLFSAETNREYELFNRIFQKYLPSNLIINKPQEIFDNCQLKIAYFSLLRSYLSLRQELSIGSITKFYECSADIEQEYCRWEKYFNLGRN